MHRHNLRSGANLGVDAMDERSGESAEGEPSTSAVGEPSMSATAESSESVRTVIEREQNVSAGDSDLTSDMIGSQQDVPNESPNTSFQLYLRVLEGLNGTRAGMNELRSCMHDAHTGMNDTRAGMEEARNGMYQAREGIDDLRRLICQQNENINRLIGAMASMTTRINGNDNARQANSQSATGPTPGDTNAPNVVPPNPSQARIKVSRDTIPYFEARPSSDPLAKSQELETWLRRIELTAPWDAEDARIQLARTYCKGTADLVINSPEFENIETWTGFKGLLRQKFRGTRNSSDFFNNLQRKVLKPGQTPQDFYLEVEGIVYLGAKDYPSEIGDSTALIKRIFLAGLPRDLADLLVACENLPLHEIVAKANKLFITRSSASSNESSRRLPVPVASAQTPALVAPTRESVPGESATRDSNHNSNNQTPYCYFHRTRGHTTANCRSRPQGQVCWRCSSPEHLRIDCPFSQGQPDSAQSQTGRNQARAPDLR